MSVKDRYFPGTFAAHVRHAPTVYLAPRWSTPATHSDTVDLAIDMRLQPELFASQKQQGQALKLIDELEQSLASLIVEGRLRVAPGHSEVFTTLHHEYVLQAQNATNPFHARVSLRLAEIAKDMLQAKSVDEASIAPHREFVQQYFTNQGEAIQSSGITRYAAIRALASEQPTLVVSGNRSEFITVNELGRRLPLFAVADPFTVNPEAELYIRQAMLGRK